VTVIRKIIGPAAAQEINKDGMCPNLSERVPPIGAAHKPVELLIETRIAATAADTPNRSTAKSVRNDINEILRELTIPVNVKNNTNLRNQPSFLGSSSVALPFYFPLPPLHFS